MALHVGVHFGPIFLIAKSDWDKFGKCEEVFLGLRYYGVTCRPEYKPVKVDTFCLS